ncbi:MAG TPA: hypothetical protein VF664_04080, partial [Cystobacter sp.]
CRSRRTMPPFPGPTPTSKPRTPFPARLADVPDSGLLAQLKKSEEVSSYGRVQPAEGTYIYDIPDTAKGKKKLYPRNTRVFVSRRLPGNWYLVRLDHGEYGYVNSTRVWVDPPDPNAYLYTIPLGQGALTIAEQEFLKQAKSIPGAKPIQWGMDWRHYVRVLVYANQGATNGTGPRGIAYADKSQKWDKTKTIAGVDIWIPSLEFAQRLKGKLPSDSVSYNLYQTVVKRLGPVGELALGRAALEAGLLHGAFEAVWDVLAGIGDLVGMVWSAIKSLFNGELFSFLGELWNWVEKLSLTELLREGLEAFLGAVELIKKGIDDFLTRWKHENFLRKWHFRGWVVGYAIAEILMAVFSGGVAVLAWTGKLGQVLAKFPRIVKLLEKAKATAKTLNARAKKKLDELDKQKRKLKRKLQGDNKHTKPTGKKGTKPTGKKKPELGSVEERRSIRRENETADTLADAGYKLQQDPRPRFNGKEPDYIMEGDYFDCYAPKTGNIDNIRDGISKKVKADQTDRIVVNLDDSSCSASDVADVLKRKPPKNLLEVLVVKNKVITHVYPQ